MKKKTLMILLIIVVVLVIAFLFFNKKTISTISLDINPSIEIKINSKEEVLSVIALNDDANNVISDELIGKKLNEVIKVLINVSVDKGYIGGGLNEIILYTDGNENVEKYLNDYFEEKQIEANIIKVDKITKKDIELSKEYDVSPAKISYVRSITVDNKNVSLDDLVNKSANELKEIKETGNYCDEGYKLENGKCLKEINRISAKINYICPSYTYEYKGECYKEERFVNGEAFCPKDRTLENNECVINIVESAKAICEEGEFDEHNNKCVIKTYVGDAKEYCRLTPATDILIDHKCYGPKPMINGGCLNGDKIINGKCVDMNSYYKADWVCPDGSFITNPDGSLMHGDTKCYKETKTNPKSYYCDEGYTLDGTKCLKKEYESVQYEKECPSGYKKLNDKCIGEKYAKVEDYYCEGDNILFGNECIIYEIVEPNHN